jgi:hypothetical protein
LSFLKAERNSPNSLLGVTPKIETVENIPIYSEWRVDEAISALELG